MGFLGHTHPGPDSVGVKKLIGTSEKGFRKGFITGHRGGDKRELCI
jgi:hypothetical protein